MEWPASQHIQIPTDLEQEGDVSSPRDGMDTDDGFPNHNTSCNLSGVSYGAASANRLPPIAASQRGRKRGRAANQMDISAEENQIRRDRLRNRIINIMAGRLPCRHCTVLAHSSSSCSPPSRWLMVVLCDVSELDTPRWASGPKLGKGIIIRHATNKSWGEIVCDCCGTTLGLPLEAHTTYTHRPNPVQALANLLIRSVGG